MTTFDDNPIDARVRQLLADPDLRRAFSAHTVHGDSAVLAVLAWLRRGDDSTGEHGEGSHVVRRSVAGYQHDPNASPAQPLLVQGHAGPLDHGGDRKSGELDTIPIRETV